MQDKVYAAVRILQKGLLERETEVRHIIEDYCAALCYHLASMITCTACSCDAHDSLAVDMLPVLIRKTAAAVAPHSAFKHAVQLMRGCDRRCG